VFHELGLVLEHRQRTVRNSAPDLLGRLQDRGLTVLLDPRIEQRRLGLVVSLSHVRNGSGPPGRRLARFRGASGYNAQDLDPLDRDAPTAST